jgi:hypothetical protein
MSSSDRQRHKGKHRDEACLSEHTIVCTTSKLRIGWDLAFAEVAARHEDTLLDDVGTTDWDRCEWEWSPIFVRVED